MRLSALLKGTDVALVGDDVDIASLTMDSRSAAPGALFLAIPGLRVDGKAFMDDARARGAAACLEVSRADVGLIAANFYGRPAERLRLFGVTGTNGKTSVTYFLAAVLRAAGFKTGVIGTTGAFLDGEPLDIPYATSTTPDAIELHRIFSRMADGGAQCCVMEATSHALALDKLCGLRFEVGAFTNLTRDHLDFHKDFDDYAAAKAKLFAHCAISVANADDPYCGQVLADAAGAARTYGINGGDYRALHVEMTAGGSAFDADGERYHIPIPGRFTVYNALAVIAAAREAGIPAGVIQSALANLSGVPGRIQSIPNTRGFTVIVDYAHTPDGLENILSAAREFTAGELVAVFGCGGERDRVKRPMMGEIAGRLADAVIVTSDNPRGEEPGAIIEEILAGLRPAGKPYEAHIDREAAIRLAIGRAKPGDAVVIAGKGHEDYQEFENGRRVHFNDAELAQKILNEMG